MNRIVKVGAAIIAMMAALAACTERIDETPAPRPNQTSPEAPRG